MACKDKCRNFPFHRKRGRYLDGFKRCNTCECFFIVVGVFCGCCGMRIKHNPKHNDTKIVFRH